MVALGNECIQMHTDLQGGLYTRMKMVLLSFSELIPVLYFFFSSSSRLLMGAGVLK